MSLDVKKTRGLYVTKLCKAVPPLSLAKLFPQMVMAENKKMIQKSAFHVAGTMILLKLKAEIKMVATA